MTNMNDENNPSRGEGTALAADANFTSAAADASRGARGSSSVASEEALSDPLFNILGLCRSPDLTEDSLRQGFQRLSSHVDLILLAITIVRWLILFSSTSVPMNV